MTPPPFRVDREHYIDQVTEIGLNRCGKEQTQLYTDLFPTWYASHDVENETLLCLDPKATIQGRTVDEHFKSIDIVLDFCTSDSAGNNYCAPEK